MSVETVLGVTVVKVVGALKLGEPTLDELRGRCRDLASREVVRVVLDLEGVLAIDTSGVGVLVHAYTSLKNRNGECKLLNPRRLTAEVLRVVGLLNVFEVYQDRNTAIASFDRAA